MNIQNIFYAVESDEMNPPLPLVVLELERQGYKVKIEGLEVNAEDMEDKIFEDLERATNEFNVEITNEKSSQKFKIVFTDYHKFNFQSR